MMSIFSNRMNREAETIKVMVGIYCGHHHQLKVSDCETCSVIQNYALDRLHFCPYQEGKTSCKNCPIHCYKPAMKDEVKKVMRFAGPRMALRHPILTIFHFIDDRRKEPVVAPKKSRTIGVDEDCDVCPGPLNSSAS
ncbi:MAG: nitrous oxide-stimulated promoter family protein [Candidatus Marinimicrobia bacterium]|nr:nitrous oxide-stimulated promoter family protein [Candidatus Neomarinimicrobiota bacterium]